MVSSLFRSRFSVGVAVLVLLTALSVAALATAATVPSSPPHLKKDLKIAALVPKAVRSSGVLTVGTDATDPPFESRDPKSQKIVGFDVDLAQGLADVMGLKLKMVNISFDTLIPSLAAGKFNVALSDIGDTKTREQVLDFVDYFWPSVNIVVVAGNPKNLATNNLCGDNVGIERGTIEQTTYIPAFSDACTSQGKPAINAVVFSSTNDAYLALSSNRIDAVLADSITQTFAAAQSQGKLQTAGPLIWSKNPGGVAIPKQSGLVAPIHVAMQKLIKIGYYKTLLKKWNVFAIALRDPNVNGATS